MIIRPCFCWLSFLFLMLFVSCPAFSQTIEQDAVVQALAQDADVPSFHRPAYLQTGSSTKVKVAYSGITHPVVTHPGWLEEFPIQEKLWVIFDGETKCEAKLWKSLSFGLGENYRWQNSKKLIERLERQQGKPALLTAGKWRLDLNEDYFQSELSDQQKESIDRLFFWKLIRRDGLLCTFAANKYWGVVLRKHDLARPDEQTNELKAISEKLYEDALKLEEKLIEEYRQILSEFCKEELVSTNLESKKSKKVLAFDNLDILTLNVRQQLGDEDHRWPTVNMRYRYEGLGGLTPENPRQVWILPEAGVTLSFLNRLSGDKTLQALFEKEKLPEAIRQKNKLINQVQKIDSAFAREAPTDKNIVVRSLEIENSVEQCVAEVISLLKDEHRTKFDDLLTLEKIRVLGVGHLLSQLSNEKANIAAEQFQEWVERTDEAFAKFEQMSLEKFMSVLSTEEQKLVEKQMGKRSSYVKDGFSQMRLSFRFKF